MASLLLRGNAWGVITDRRGAGMLPAQVDLVHPDRVAVTTNGDGRRVIRIAGKEVPRSALFHVKAYPWPGQLEGLSPIAYARESIGLGLGAEKYGAKFFGDGATPQGVLSSDQRISPQQAQTLQERWEARHKGKRRIAVLSDGAKFQPITIAPDEAQFIQTQKFNVATICRFYGVPPEMMAGETAGHEAYTSPEMRGTDFLTFTLRPWLYRVERAISAQLLASTQRAKFNAGGFVRATLRDRYEAHRIGIEAGFLTRNEACELEDRPPIAGLDQPGPPPAEGSHDRRTDSPGSDRPAGQRRGDGRTLVGPLLPWGVEARVLDRGRLVLETFERGALQGNDPGRIPLTALHPRDNQQLPIGITRAIDERADAAWGEWRVSKTAAGDEVLSLAADGVPLGLSIGFREVPGGSRWSPDQRRVTRTRAELDHIAIVRTPAYVGAGVVGVRSEPEQVGRQVLQVLARLR